MKALFLLRHYNDIDHITPVIIKWIESGHHCDVVLIGQPKFLQDYRIQYLSTLDGVEVTLIRRQLPVLLFIKWRAQTLLMGRGVRRTVLRTVADRLISILNFDRRQRVWQAVARKFLTSSFSNEDAGVVVFDWLTKNSPVAFEWVETVVAMAHSMGLGAVSLPHGDSPHSSQLIRHGEWRLQPNDLYAAGRIFDRLVVPNELCAQRFRPFMDMQSIAVLGSPRYCDEWLAKLKMLLPPSRLEPDSANLKIVLFLRKREFTIFWEEVEEIVHMISTFPGVVLMIKPHTRGGWKQSLTRSRALQKLPNIHIAADDVHSAHLLAWADVIIDLATSVAFEAVKAGKPVLAADYLHAGRSVIADYLPETVLRCRDDVNQKISHFLEHGCDPFYNEAHRQKFIREMIDGPDSDVLPRYVRLLEEQAKQKR